MESDTACVGSYLDALRGAGLRGSRLVGCLLCDEHSSVRRKLVGDQTRLAAVVACAVVTIEDVIAAGLEPHLSVNRYFISAEIRLVDQFCYYLLTHVTDLDCLLTVEGQLACKALAAAIVPSLQHVPWPATEYQSAVWLKSQELAGRVMQSTVFGTQAATRLQRINASNADDDA
jgi:hypothetical protein